MHLQYIKNFYYYIYVYTYNGKKFLYVIYYKYIHLNITNILFFILYT